MILLMVVVCILVVVLIVVAVKKESVLTGVGNKPAYESRGALFTLAERSFLGVLEQALDGRYRVFGKVRLGDIVKPAKGSDKSRRTSAQNRINQKHVDFVVCASSDLAVIGVIELDDKSHDRNDRGARDQFVDTALSGAGIAIIHFPAKQGYTLIDVRSKLAESFAIRPVAPVSAPVPPASLGEMAMPAKDVNTEMSTDSAAMPVVAPVQVIAQAAAPVCPKCDSAMVKRQAAKGPHAGKFFWACSAFPKCRQVVAVGEG